MGKCVVIGLQSTGEARTLEAVENADGDLTDFVSTATGVLQVSFNHIVFSIIGGAAVLPRYF